MALVYIPTPLAALAGGKSPLKVEGSTVREIIENLEEACPGIRERLVEGGRLRRNISVAVDGEVSPLGLLEPVSAKSEVHFVAAISGGAKRSGANYGVALPWAGCGLRGEPEHNPRRVRPPKA